MQVLQNMSVPYSIAGQLAIGKDMRLNNYLGLRFERLVVVERLPNKSKTDTNSRWLCQCDCGRTAAAYGQDLKRGKMKSCGCLQAENRTKHGMAHTAVYAVWKQMFQRCENPNCDAYHNYGGRGISVCQEWQNFEVFLADMGDRPKGFTIERIDVNGNYCKDNCEWATRKTQNNNTRRNRVYIFRGESKNLAQWSEHLGIRWETLRTRIDVLKWPIDVALSMPINDTAAVKYTHNGKTLSLQEWAAETGIGYETIRKRVQGLKWSISKALTTPVSSKGLN